MLKKTLLAIDLGAESGRVMAAHFDGKRIDLEEVHRFPNTSAVIQRTRYWDFLALWAHIETGISKGKAYHPASIGIDTWGVDFALLDRQGTLLNNVVHYRDERTNGMMDAAFARISKAQIFAQTGIQFIQVNTVYQLMSLVENRSPLLDIAHTFLTAPDLLNYWLTGEKACEFTNATTTQLYNPIAFNWAYPMMDNLDIPGHIFPPVIQPGTRLGSYDGIPVIAPACHDTGSAVAGVPTTTANYAYLSSGTWSLFGLEVQKPIINASSLAANVTNEGGAYGTYRLLKNVMGLWLLQQCKATWAAEGNDMEYGSLVSMAENAPALVSLIEPDDSRFLPPGDHPAHIRDLCQRSGQPIPKDKAAVVRCVLESLALKYRYVLDSLIALTGQTVEVIHVIGGGSQNRLLCQMTANATGRVVLAGPTEATALGNALVQLIALGEVENIAEGRRIIAQGSAVKRYEPQQRQEWEAAYERYINLWSLQGN